MNAFDVQLHAALTGDFDKEVERGRQRTERALYRAVETASGETQAKWRIDVEGSGLAKASQLAKTVRRRTYRNKGLNPAALVYSSFPLIERAFEGAQAIRAKQGKFLIVPNPDVWPGGRVRRARSGGGGDGSASLQAAVARFGKLKFVPPRDGRAGLLVAEALYSAKTGRFRRARASEGFVRGATSIVVFFVVKQARQPRLLHGDVVRDRARRDFPARVAQLFPRFFEEDERAGPIQLGNGE